LNETLQEKQKRKEISKQSREGGAVQAKGPRTIKKRGEKGFTNPIFPRGKVATWRLAGFRKRKQQKKEKESTAEGSSMRGPKRVKGRR